MAHSYDQTLIQRMGFADPDRRSPAHDDACIQIATDPERFARAVRERLDVREARCDLEVPLQKGDGKYASTVGFIDAMVTWCAGLSEVSAPALGFRWVGGKHYPVSSMLVEVKTKIPAFGDLLRQMNLYREYRRVDEYVVWSLDPADSKYAKLLAGQGYRLLAGELP